MSDDLIDDGFYGPNPSSDRPQFLTVLCILTFIGSGLAIFSVFGSNMAQYTDLQPVWYTALMLLCSAGTAYGAWEMWNLKRRGLIIYTVAQSVSIVMPYILFYYLVPAFYGQLMGNALFLASIIPAGFIAMYWANAKHLNDGYSDLD